MAEELLPVPHPPLLHVLLQTPWLLDVQPHVQLSAAPAPAAHMKRATPQPTLVADSLLRRSRHAVLAVL
jgi:hypothetical protein